MALSTQDLVKGLDITGLTVVTGSEMNQLVDVARTESSKGLLLYTVDSGVGVPDVPNPHNSDIMGIIPSWWTRYIWVRIPNPSDGIGQVFAYAWNPNLAPNATYLNWQNVGQRGIDAYSLAAMAGIDATNAQTTANTALTNSTNAVAQANDALTKATTAEDSAAIAQQTADEAKSMVSQAFLTGEVKLYCGSTKTFANDSDTGWLDCTGQAVSRTVFAGLFNTIGSTYGGGDGTTTFNVPDFRSQVPVGVGQSTDSSGATTVNKEIGVKYGVENVTLTGLQTGVGSHTHGMNFQRYKADGNTRDIGGAILAITPPNDINISTDANGVTDASQSHTNLPPMLAIRFIIKT